MKAIKTILITLYLFNLSLVSFSQIKKLRVIVVDFKVVGTKLTEKDGKAISVAVRAALQNSIIDTAVEILERQEDFLLYNDRSNAAKIPGVFNRNTATKLGRKIEANYYILGEVSQNDLFQGNRVSMRLVDIETGRIISSQEKVLQEKTNFNQDIAELTYEFEEKLNIKHLKPTLYNTRFEDNIKSILNAYKKKYDDKSCYIYGSAKGDPFKEIVI